MRNFFSRNTKNADVPAKGQDAALQDGAVAEMEKPVKADKKSYIKDSPEKDLPIAEAPIPMEAEPAMTAPMMAPALSPEIDGITSNSFAQVPVAVKKVINVGCGVYAPHKLHAVFRNEGWKEVRLDINPDVEPDLIGSITDMRGVVADASFDALWSSHNVEHLCAHEVIPAFSEFRRILKPDGFALITCPDMEAIAKLILDGGLYKVAYQSPAGPITPLDMLYGLSSAIAKGNHYMGHRTGYTAQGIGQVLQQAGFAKAWVGRDNHFNLWAIGLMPETHEETVKEGLAKTQQRFVVN